MHGAASTGRPAPAWLIDGPFEESPVGVLKSGKEAEVFLVERRSSSGTYLLAHKRYRPRHPGRGELKELGFSKGTIYRHDVVYREGWHLGARDARAIAGRTRYGDSVRSSRWIVNELEMLQRAWTAGVSVPYPVERTEDGVLMEYIGDRGMAAPRLVQAQVDRPALADAWRRLVEDLRRLTRAGIVHGDLSVYNVLWWHDRLVIIDLPQAVDFATNVNAPELLRRDIGNVAGWFGRRGIEIDEEALFAELLAESF